MNTQIALAEKTKEVSTLLDGAVKSVLEANQTEGFMKAFMISDGMVRLQENLKPEYMKPIMAMMGYKLGFKTDRDNKPANDRYSEEVVKRCLIEAVMMGVQPYGNQFNIIAGNCYITKEGFGYALNTWPGLTYTIIPEVKQVSADKSSVLISCKIEWTLNGVTKEKDVPFALKMDTYTTLDAAIGKSTRKARAWLHNVVSGMELPSADETTEDVVHEVVEEDAKVV